MVINGKKYTYPETWSIAVMICGQDGRGGISRGVFCPRIPGNENQVNVQEKAKSKAFSYQIFTLIPEYLDGKIIRIKRVQSVKSLTIPCVVE